MHDWSARGAPPTPFSPLFPGPCTVAHPPPFPASPPQARRQRVLEKRLQRERQRMRRLEAADARAARAAREDEEEGQPGRRGPPPSQAGGEDEGGEVDDDDLIADLPADLAAQQQQRWGREPGGFKPPTIVGSVSMGLSRAAVALHNAFHRMAVTAPPRRSLTRPRRMD
jgi:hypothetical protein